MAEERHITISTSPRVSGPLMSFTYFLPLPVLYISALPICTCCTLPVAQERKSFQSSASWVSSHGNLDALLSSPYSLLSQSHIHSTNKAANQPLQSMTAMCGESKGQGREGGGWVGRIREA